MTPNKIALVCQNKLNMLDVTNADMNTNGIEQFNLSCTLLEHYIKRHFLSFEMTDLVYHYAKRLCEEKIRFENWYRNIGYVYSDRIKAYKEFGGNINWLQAAKGKHCV